MNTADACSLIESTMKRMNALYSATVFDEWVVIRAGPPATLERYAGSRPDEFRRNFARDIVPLEREAADRSHEVGDFDFARAATGTQFDAVLKLGEGSYLLCNNTQASMEQIRANPLWLKAQVPFVELSDKFRAKPLVFA